MYTLFPSSLFNTVVISIYLLRLLIVIIVIIGIVIVIMTITAFNMVMIKNYTSNLVKGTLTWLQISQGLNSENWIWGHSVYTYMKEQIFFGFETKSNIPLAKLNFVGVVGRNH